MAIKGINLQLLPIRVVKFALTTPLVTGPLLYAILYHPSKVYSILPEPLHKYISPALIRTLQLCFGFGVLQKINSKASELALNNWKSNGEFGKEKELVLITGGSSGIGLLMAKRLAEKGVEVVNFDLRSPTESLASNIHFYEVDVTSSTQISKAAAAVRESHGDPTVLINNAGIGAWHTILEEPEEMIRKTFEVNTMAHFWMVREFLPKMIEKNHGHVVTIASMASFVGPSPLVDYACTKAAAMSFHEGLSTELKTKYKAPNVRTSIIHPSWVRTPLLEPLYKQPGWSAALLEPEEIADVTVKQVFSGKSGRIILPKVANIAASVRAFPDWFQIGLRSQVSNSLPQLSGV